MITTLCSQKTPTSLRGWLSTDTSGLPRYWLTVWEALHGPGMRTSTAGKKLSVIDRFYRHVADVTGEDCLDALLANSDLDRLEPLMESFFVALRNVSMRTKTDRTYHWATVFGFVRDIIDRQGHIRDADDLAVFQARIRRLNRLYAVLTPARTAKRKVVRALPASVVDDLYDILSPDSQRNPYRTERERWRNYSLFLLYLHQGLRRSEALILPVNAIKEEVNRDTGEIVHWVNVVETDDDDDEFDSRSDRPALKTEQSRRQVPMSADLASAVTHYADHFRGKQNHPFLFPSNQGRPLGKRMVNHVFEVASAKLSESAQKGLRDRTGEDTVSPHPLRHTCAVHRLAELVDDGMEMTLALQLLRSFFGWSRTSTMPQHYASAYFENRLSTVWQRRFDSRVSILRSLDQLDGEYPGKELDP